MSLESLQHPSMCENLSLSYGSDAVAERIALTSGSTFICAGNFSALQTDLFSADAFPVLALN